MTHIQPLHPDHWLLLKEMRCAALADTPHAFTATLEDALNRSDEEWVQLAKRRASDPDSVTYFVFCGSDPCGMAGCILHDTEPVTANFVSVWVKPNYRRRGAGIALADYAESWARENGADTLYVDVTDLNKPALEFYYSHGFRDTGKRTPYPANPEWSVMVLALSLV